MQVAAVDDAVEVVRAGAPCARYVVIAVGCYEAAQCTAGLIAGIVRAVPALDARALRARPALRARLPTPR
eukprot:scaffold23491_cov26-Tisochrysis_lutea.AAC.3